MGKHLFLILAFLCYYASAFSQKVIIKGTVIDDKKEPIELATVRVEGTGYGTSCDLKGRYRFVCDSSDSLVIVASMVGQETRKRVLKSPVDSVTVNFMLPTKGYELGEVEVKEVRTQTSPMTTVSIKDLDHMGNASGGSIEQVIATQAGVSTHSELSTQYNVRGGSFDENSVYINGVEVYRPLLIRSGQQEGLSIINPDLVGKIQFSAGGFEAKYGEKMSSVLDIEYKKVNGLEAAVSGSLLGASGYVGYGNKKFSWLNAIRYKTMKNLLGTLQTKGEYDPRDFDYQTYLTWTPNKKWTFSALGVISLNNYNFTPSDRETKFGTSEIVKDFKVYFDGKEKDRFHTYFGSLSASYKFNENSELSLNLSAFKTTEQEAYDISGQYWLSNEGEVEGGLGIGTYMEHARNRLNASMINVGLSGSTRLKGHTLRYGLLTKFESVSERMREWEFRDSAGYSLPHSDQRLDLIYNLSSYNKENSTHLEIYAQDTWRHEFKVGELVLNYGARFSYWSWNKEALFSPRATVAFIPAACDRLALRLSTGLYYQTPFYKEMRDTTVVNGNTIAFLNKDIKSQRSVHVVLAGEFKFRVANRPFKVTAEAYYKHLSNLIPYNIDNVRVVYYGGNIAKGYATGIDLKLYGEFVPGTDSWISVGLMKTEERINGGPWIPRPTDQRFTASLFFSDYFPKTDRWKLTLRGHYAGGLPFGPPHTGRERQVYRMRDYKRVDIGLSYRLLKNEDHNKRNRFVNTFKNIWLGIDAFNVLGINNVNSYYWITDITNNQYAVPNYLTGRQINARLLIEL